MSYGAIEAASAALQGPGVVRETVYVAVPAAPSPLVQLAALAVALCACVCAVALVAGLLLLCVEAGVLAHQAAGPVVAGMGRY